jgi:hypothetical protein
LGKEFEVFCVRVCVWYFVEEVGGKDKKLKIWIYIWRNVSFKIISK